MLELKNITWIEKNGKEILHDINFRVEDKTITAITGPNGGGKTSLARLLMGIEKPSTGQILLNGEDITALDVTERAKAGIGFAFQAPVRFKGIRVRQLLEIAAGQRLDKNYLCSLLLKVGLCAQDYMDREIDATLSGGEIKRIELASVLARPASLLILDEPEAGIDLWSFEQLIQTFTELHAELDRSMIIISHQERILRIAEQIILIADGGIRLMGKGETVLNQILADEQAKLKCCNRRELFHDNAD